MGSYAEGGGPPREGKDPLVRFLLGCLAVAAVLGAIVVCVALVVGWKLTRDEAPGRSTEAFLIGDETRYWRIDLKADDAGLAALFTRFDEINDDARRSALKGTFLEALPLPHRQARLDEFAPFTFEFATGAADPDASARWPRSWSARGTLSHGMLRLRATLKMMRWFASRDPGKGATISASGVEVTEIHDNGVRFAFATAGNRILVASEGSRLGSMLGATEQAATSVRPDLIERHTAITLDGEDAWGFIAAPQIGAPANPIAIGGAVCSFDVNERDELAFRATVLDKPTDATGRGFAGTRDDCVAVAAAFLPGVPVTSIDVDEPTTDAATHGAVTFTGRIADLSKVLGTLLTSLTEWKMRETRRHLSLPETPSAIPTPPSRLPPSGHRTGTASAPPSAGSPTPPR